jgi:adenylosuccinate lyase
MGQNGRVSNLSSQPLSPLDGRYQQQVAPLSEYLSESGLNRARVQVEIEWLIFLVQHDPLGINKVLGESEIAALRATYLEFSDSDVAKIKEIEDTTRHDVKAIEYFIREKLVELGRTDLSELVHFACTSEDINNLSYAITVRDAYDNVWLPATRNLVEKLKGMAFTLAESAMLSRTHGQPATPTTMGKELAVFVHRLQRQLSRIDAQPLLGKFSGATGTFAAHVAAAPDADWPKLSEEFLSGLGIDFNPLTTQIESHDWQAELFQKTTHINSILHNLATDIWTYISLNYFKQIPVKGATGSSTMPHKVNPIRFENAEANLELSNAILGSLNQTLVTSRLQRDLTDSSAQRNIGVGVGHSLLAIDNITRGLDEITINDAVLLTDLLDNWEVLGEAIQTAIRADVARGLSEISDPYALLKELTRGKRVGQEDLLAFVSGLDLPQETKDRLMQLKPQTYVGLASKLVERVED